MKYTLWQFTLQTAALGVMLGTASTCCAQQPAVPANSARGPHFAVDVKRALSYGSDANPLYELTIAYSFDDEKTLWIRGLGTVPAKAELVYFSSAKEVEFRETPKGPHLVSVPIRATFFPAASGPQFPSVSDFHNPGAKQTSHKPLADVTTTLLAALTDFGNGPPRSCPLFEDNCLLTAWTSLPLAGRYLQGQVAVMITFIPVESTAPGGPKTQIIVAPEERETLIGSGVWHEASEPVRVAAKEKLTKLADVVNKLVGR
jgi:hypothetical protein